MQNIINDFEKILQEIYISVNKSIVSIKAEEKGIFGDSIVGGAGIIISTDGFIITNAHVVKDADVNNICVKLNDGRYFGADIKGIDVLTDVALLKISASELVPAKLGNSEECKIGQIVLAIGNPLSLEETLTMGIISALKRYVLIETGGRVHGCIQTDAAINPGNSGGALVNSNGEVIGIVFAGYGEGISYAIPINLAKRIVDKIIKEGEVKRADIGLFVEKIELSHLPVEIITKHKIPNEYGILINKIKFESSLEKAGIEEEDIIISIDGIIMNSIESLDNFLLECPAGKKNKIKVLRGESVIEKNIVT
ncbi:MAG: hypothetical protein A2539_08530 [Elusimicrobia bacterium RIFOXYD2_FULL_34_15]|nr:MAG: hypothetical protein A2539_08530 [Elusimicrobia bacterium RIFOXYD2_FULL_34_15]